MPKRSRKETPAVRQPKSDPNRAAFDLLKQIIDKGESDGKNPMAVAMGRLGGLKGGRARAAKLSKEERSASALKAARARWDKHKDA